MLERMTQITTLQDKIAHVKARFEAECKAASEKLQPTMDTLHNQMLSIQQKMASNWRQYSKDHHKAEYTAQALVTDLEAHIRILEQKNLNAASFLAPVRRLPEEILAEIFHFAIGCNNHSPMGLVRVCQTWRAVILSMPRAWSSVRLSTWTEADKIKFILELTGGVPLDVEIDTGADVSRIVDEKGVGRYAGIERAVRVASRWRNLTITSFPSKADVDAHLAPTVPGFTFNGPMNALESLRIKNPCENSIVFEQLLDAVANSSHDQLVDMELSSPNAIHHFAQPQYVPIFRRLVTFKVDVRKMRDEVHILTHFEQLETLEAYRLPLPIYPIEVDLPLVRTLKRTKIKAVSVQWMAGRTFPKMEECIIIWPQFPERLERGVGFPACTHFTYDDHIIESLPNFHIPKLDSLVVRNVAWGKQCRNFGYWICERSVR
jgi:hypothetical protein